MPEVIMRRLGVSKLGMAEQEARVEVDRTLEKLNSLSTFVALEGCGTGQVEALEIGTVSLEVGSDAG